MKLITLMLFLGLFSIAGKTQPSVTKTRTISAEVLKDKISGGWAGKMLGVTYGAPVEFRALCKTFEDPITWVPSDVIGSKEQDDLYVQLTFLMTMDKYGIDAPAKRFQEQFAKAGYMLWHANVQARKNYFDSIFPPKSGHPDYNLHADDIDFQIEADYIGFMCPGMPQTARKLAEKVGHIMNYGDGVYGGIFIGALYSQAYFESDILQLVKKALLSIPVESDYAKIVNDVILLHEHYPADWRASWKELEAKWGSVHICEAGAPFNIDAKLNGAYVVLGLLYGEGNPLKTMEITARCGQDADCNPSNAMAVLGVVKGLSGLPPKYREAVQSMGDTLFVFTSYSFNKAVKQTIKYAKELAVQNGGSASETELKIKVQNPQLYKSEVAFPKLVADHRVTVFEKNGWKFKGKWATFNTNNEDENNKLYDEAKFSSQNGDEAVLDFEGTGISVCGNWHRECGKADIFIDGKFKRSIDEYFWFANQSHNDMDLYHITNLKPGKHQVKVIVKGEKRPEATAAKVYLSKAIIFKTADKKNENYKFTFQK
ncbi:MAG: ADP-ribosylglycohydrolase family protein [Mariniphaga sp.]